MATGKFYVANWGERSSSWPIALMTNEPEYKSNGVLKDDDSIVESITMKDCKAMFGSAPTGPDDWFEIVAPAEFDEEPERYVYLHRDLVATSSVYLTDTKPIMSDGVYNGEAYLRLDQDDAMATFGVEVQPGECVKIPIGKAETVLQLKPPKPEPPPKQRSPRRGWLWNGWSWRAVTRWDGSTRFASSGLNLTSSQRDEVRWVD